jgi:ribosomal protein S1
MPSDRPEESFAALFEQSSQKVPGRRGARVGDTVDVIVVQVGKDAVFVELEGHRQGFVETNDLKAPDGTLKVAVGDRLRARVAAVDPVHGTRLTPTVEAAVQIGASVTLGAAVAGMATGGIAGAAAREDAVKVAVGQIVSGTVERVESYGVFLQIDGTRGRAGRGLVPTAELGVPRGADLRKLFPLGTKLKAKILDIADGKMRMSVRALKDDEERAQYEGFRDKEKQAAEPKGFGTLGDLLKNRKGK